MKVFHIYSIFSRCSFVNLRAILEVQKGEMSMVGVLVNGSAIVFCGLLGLLFKRKISASYSDHVMTAIGLCLIGIAVSGLMDGSNALITITSMILGTLTGFAFDIDGKFNRFAEGMERRFCPNAAEGSLAHGFITASLIVCVGAMGILGALRAGLDGDLSLLLTKTVLDGITCVFLAISLGAGVLLSSVSVLTLEGSIVMLAGILEPFVNEMMIAELTCTGSLLILALGTNLLGITKLKTLNYLPALVFTPFVTVLFGLLSI